LSYGNDADPRDVIKIPQAVLGQKLRADYILEDEITDYGGNSGRHHKGIRDARVQGRQLGTICIRKRE
jgi:hypothetical protein